MANKLQIKRGNAGTLPNGSAGEPLFTIDTFDLYIGKGDGTNQRFQKYISSGNNTQVLLGDGTLGTYTVGTVTSVDMSVPTGFAIANNPITSSGTLALSFASGYSLPTNAKQTDWDTAYTNRITSLTTTGNSGSATLSSNTLNIPTYTLSGLGGEPAITAGTTLQYWRGDKSFQTLDTFVVPENTNLYFTEPRVRTTPLTGLNLSGGGTIVATDTVLQAFGKVQNQISALVGGVMYAGTWNANTNTPSLTSSVGTKGNYYIVTTAGSTNLNGITDWKIGDWAIFNGSTWDKVDNTDAVSSVNGYTGAVNLVTDDVPESGTPVNLYFTNTRARGAVSAAAPLSYSTLTGQFSIPQSSGSADGYLSSSDWTTFNGKQPALNGTGFVKISGTTISYDNSTYYLASNPNSYIALTALSAGVGISYNNTTGVITNSAPDQVVALTGGGTTTITGTYPNFTISSADQYVGTVTSVSALTIGTTGTDISSTVANSTTTPVITLNIPTASATNRGALSAADWTTFNNKQNALTNPVTGTGTSGYLTKWTGATTVGNSIINDDGFSAVVLLDTAGEFQIKVATALKLVMYGNSTNGIINTPSGVALKLQTDSTDRLTIASTGAATFSSSVTASSIIKSGGTASEYLMADGSTSTLTNPVTGTGTSGFHVKWAGTNTVGNSIIDDDGFGASVALGTGGSFNIKAGGSIRVALSGNTTHGIIDTPSGIGFKLQTDAVDRLTIAATGAATFSSSVTAGGVIKSLAALQTGNSSGNPTAQFAASGGNTYLDYEGDLNIRYNFGALNVATFSSSGNLGLGVTPSAYTVGKSIEVGTLGNSFWGVGINSVQIASNYYFDGAYKYANNGYANRYDIGSSGGQHIWYNAASGTANGTITWTQAMTLNASGNLGLGVTPNTWFASRKAIQVNTGGAFAASDAGFAEVYGNAYLNVSAQNIYSANGAASLYQIGNGHTWFTAPSGTAGNTITFTQAMTLDASGNLLIGATSVLSSVANYKSLVVGGVNGAILDLGTGATSYGRISADSNALNIQALESGDEIQFRLASTQAMTLDASGRLGIGTTTPSEKLEVNGAIKTAAPTVTGGTAKPWKLGQRVAATGTHTDSLVVEVDGTIYYLMAATV